MKKSNNSYPELKAALESGNTTKIEDWIQKWSSDPSKVPIYKDYYNYIVSVGCKSIEMFRVGYQVETRSGKNWVCSEVPGMKDTDFKPDLTPDVMLRVGVFGGCYTLGWERDIPIEWIMMTMIKGKLQLDGTNVPNGSLNKYGVCSNQNLKEWEAKGWLTEEDPLGWFQWYIRFYLGRRTEHDKHQQNRWISYRRHKHQIVSNPGEPRLKQKQSCLQWGHNPAKEQRAIY